MKDYLIIDRSKWRTGGGGNDSNSTGKGHTALLNKQGYMCCLGFRCHQMGIPKEHLLKLHVPHDLSKDWKIPDLVNADGKNTPFSWKAIHINDDMDISPKEREKRITEHFATIGVTVEFTGKYK